MNVFIALKGTKVLFLLGTNSCKIAILLNKNEKIQYEMISKKTPIAGEMSVTSTLSCISSI